MARPITVVELTESEKQVLQRRRKASTASTRDSLRAAIVLRRSEGVRQVQVAEVVQGHDGLGVTRSQALLP